MFNNNKIKALEETITDMKIVAEQQSNAITMHQNIIMNMVELFDQIRANFENIQITLNSIAEYAEDVASEESVEIPDEEIGTKH